MLTRQDETELLTALHAGVLEQPLWSTFLERLRLRAGATRVTLVFGSGDSPMTEVTELFAGRATPHELEARYRAELYRDDPLPYHRLRPGRVYALAEFLEPNNPAHVAFSRDFLQPMGIRDLRVLRIAEPGGYNAWLSIFRGDRDFGGGEILLLGALAEHLGIAFRTLSAIEQERIRHGISATVMKRLNFCWFTLDARGRVIDTDEGAEALLRRSSVLRRDPRGRLFPTDPPAERAFSESLRAIADAPGGRARAIHLSDDPWLDMLVVPMSQRRIAGKLTAVATAYVHGEDRSGSDRRDQLRELFGLSRAEAGLALALSRGQRIAEAAVDLGITEETARYYTKQLYAKTGARGQADLVRLVMASVVMIA
jgi:DNA-binding CsgD family transcriptional regulator